MGSFRVWCGSLREGAVEFELRSGLVRNLRSGAGLAADHASRIARMPGYPVFLATVQVLFGDGYLPARVADALVGTLCIALAWLLARELFGPAEACVAAAVVAVYPFFILFVVLVLSEVALTARALSSASAWSNLSLGIRIETQPLISSSSP